MSVVSFEAYRNRKLAKQNEPFKSTVKCAGCGNPLLITPETSTNLLIGVCFPCNHTVPVGVVQQ